MGNRFGVATAKESGLGKPAIFGGLFYVSADLIDKNVFSIRQDINLFIEEILEFNATIFMVLSAVISLAWARKQVWWNSARCVFRQKVSKPAWTAKSWAGSSGGRCFHRRLPDPPQRG